MHGIRARIREPIKVKNNLISWFLSHKTVLLDAEKGSFISKKRRFLKLIRVFVGNKYIYHCDYQRLSCNAKNKRFSSTNDNMPANIRCMYA